MNKFKVGDKIVVTLKYCSESYTYFGKLVGKPYSIQNTFRYPVKLEKSKVSFAYHEEIELEEIYNSPLYKALL